MPANPYLLLSDDPTPVACAPERQTMSEGFPCCVSCNSPLYGSPKKSTLCKCPANKEFREIVAHEHYRIHREIALAYEKLELYRARPFRPLRNSIGFGASAIGAINIIITHVVAIMAVTLTAGLLSFLTPAAALVAYVYYRGNREENKTIADDEKSLATNSAELIAKHKKWVAIRYKKLVENRKRGCENIATEREKYKEIESSLHASSFSIKEQRDWGNAFSHFLGGSIGTMGVLNAIIQFTFLASLMGGPLTWSIAAAIAVGVGVFFCYKRYTHIQAKKQFECCSSAVTHRLKDISKRSEKESDENTVELENRLDRSEKRTAELENKLEHAEKELDQLRKKLEATTGTQPQSADVKLQANTSPDAMGTFSDIPSYSRTAYARQFSHGGKALPVKQICTPGIVELDLITGTDAVNASDMRHRKLTATA